MFAFPLRPGLTVNRCVHTVYVHSHTNTHRHERVLKKPTDSAHHKISRLSSVFPRTRRARILRAGRVRFPFSSSVVPNTPPAQTPTGVVSLCRGGVCQQHRLCVLCVHVNRRIMSRARVSLCPRTTVLSYVLNPMRLAKDRHCDAIKMSAT